MSAKNSLALLMLAMASVAGAQWNVDLEVAGGSPEVGYGGPSSAFGAASGQVGYWNRIQSASTWRPIANTAGVHVGVGLLASGGIGSTGGFNNPELSGDYRLLMADYHWIGDQNKYTFDGLPTGAYEVYTYAVTPWGELNDTLIHVSNSVPLGAQHVTGPIGTNTFSLGKTHAKHHAVVSAGVLVITASDNWHGVINGFQIVPVPEPSTMISLSACSFIIALRKRRRFVIPDRRKQ